MRDRKTELAEGIIEKSNRLTQIWSKLDFFNEHGFFPDNGSVGELNIKDMSIGQIVTKALNLPPWISKQTKKLKDYPEGAEKEILKANLAAKKRELEQIKALRE